MVRAKYNLVKNSKIFNIPLVSVRVYASKVWSEMYPEIAWREIKAHFNGHIFDIHLTFLLKNVKNITKCLKTDSDAVFD